MRINTNLNWHRVILCFPVTCVTLKVKLTSTLIWIICLISGYPLTAQPLDIGNRRQLFVDSRFVTAEKNIKFLVHKPRKTGDTCILAGGGYHSVLEKDGIYHLWYTVSSSIAYARSDDGIHWEYPHLNLTSDPSVSKPNNIVIGRGAGGVNGPTHGLMVFLDPNATDENCFRLVANPREFSRFVQIFSSPDGIHWKHTHHNLVTYDTSSGKFHHLDSQNEIFWDARLKKYITYIRKNTLSNEQGNKQIRNVARYESPTLSNFGDASIMPIVMSGKERDDIYTFGVFPYVWADDVYFAFPTLYYHYGDWHDEFKKEAPFNAGVLDVRFAVSRDGIIWNNFNWQSFVPLGMNGEFDSKSIYMVYGIVPALNSREMYMYYEGLNLVHGWDDGDRNNMILSQAGFYPRPGPRAFISRVVLRRDGFVSIHAPYDGGEFTTPPLRFRGNQLVLNIETASTGEVQVEIQDENGKPIPGFSIADCDIIHTANEINCPVTWNGVSLIGNLAGKTISLHFVLRDTDLYAFQFRERPAF